MSIRYSFKEKTWTALLFHTQPAYLSYLLTRDQTMAMEFKWDRPQVPTQGSKLWARGVFAAIFL